MTHPGNLSIPANKIYEKKRKYPNLRNNLADYQQDKIFLRNAVKNGSINAVVSDHNPLEEDKKKCEFELAGFGASGAQTVYAQLVKCLGDQEKIVSALAIQPRKILSLEVPTIVNGAQANLTLFNPELKWTLK